ncbi:MAG: peptidoglycan DD-metalloendopeptidase family protein [Treponema sp.]|nr:peptidoglycan DD-metalloendopeptidase family protein [Treponema sp.]
MKRTAFRITIAAALCCSLSFAAAMDWPVQDGRLIRNFGWNDRGRPVLGMAFSGGTDILASESGEVIFTRSVNDTASRLPSPLGNWVAVDHEDGLISIYSRYGGNNPPQSRVEKQTAIAAAGASGWSKEGGLFFMLYDRKDRRWINPEMIITPVRSAPPRILSYELRDAQGIPASAAQFWNLNQGRYKITVATANAQTRENYLAPYRIQCYVNGAEVGSLNFEYFSARDGSLMVYRNGLVPVRQIYAQFPAFEVADVFLNRGQAAMEIIVHDLAGNTGNAAARLIIN